jgi:tetratricopeptide (TPR) repeat protein
VGIGVGLTLLSRVLGASPGGHAEAVTLARRAVDILQPLGQGEWTAWAWSRLGIEYRWLGRLAEARDCLLHGLEMRQQRQCEGCASYSLALLGAASLDLQQPHAALAAYLEGLDLTIKHDNPPLMLAVLFGLADVARRYGEEPDAARTALLFFGAGDALRQRHGLGGSREAQAVIAQWQTPLRDAIGHTAVDAFIAAGRALSPAALVDLADQFSVASHRRPAVTGAHHESLLDALESIE